MASSMKQCTEDVELLEDESCGEACQPDSQGSKSDSSRSYKESSSSSSNKSPQSDPCSLPSVTSAWTREHIQELKIHIDDFQHTTTKPREIVELLMRPKPGQNLDTWREQKLNLDHRLSKTAHAMEDSLAFSLLDRPFDSLTMRDCVMKLLARRKDMWDLVGIEGDQEMAQLRTSYKMAGREFTENLLYFIDRKDNNESITEYMYQHLFICFLQLFSLKCHFAPWLPKTNMKINGRNVTGIPDVSIKWMRHYSEMSKPVIDWKTLMICEVKKDFKREDEPPPKQARFSSSRNFVLPFLPDGVLGQLGAELLLCYPSSLKDDHVLGMIVEQTNITFVVLSITKKQYQQLIDGTLRDDEVNGPKLYFTKSYDYLVLDDRKSVIEALLLLGYLQNYGSEYFL